MDRDIPADMANVTVVATIQSVIRPSAPGVESGKLINEISPR
jgi:hypothetical protein